MNKAGRITLSDFNIEDGALGTKTAQSGPKNRHTDPCNRIERPEPNSNIHGQPICDQGAKRRQWTKERSEEHTSELQSRQYLVCRLLLEKKKTVRYLLANVR